MFKEMLCNPFLVWMTIPVCALSVSRFAICLQSILFNCGMCLNLISFFFEKFQKRRVFSFLYISQSIDSNSFFWESANPSCCYVAPFFWRNLLRKCTIQNGMEKIIQRYSFPFPISKVIKYDEKCFREKIQYINVYTTYYVCDENGVLIFT